MEGACLFLRVRRPYGCLPTHAGSPEGERMELFDRREEGVCGVMGEEEGGFTLQPPSTPFAWAHSVMKWPVSWRPCPNNGPIQPGEESLSGPG